MNKKRQLHANSVTALPHSRLNLTEIADLLEDIDGNSGDLWKKQETFKNDVSVRRRLCEGFGRLKRKTLSGFIRGLNLSTRISMLLLRIQ